MTETHDLVIVGGGTAGLVAAAGASSLGARVALVEKDRLGGECLWTGCVPSKALIGTARVARAFRRAEAFGLDGREPAVDGGRVLESVRDARARIQPHDDPERFRDMGVDVIEGTAARLRPDGRVEAGERTLAGRSVLLATGSRPAVPPVEGLADVGYVTHETAFDREGLPASSVILGGGAVGVEFAQAYGRLGVEVTLVEMEERILPREDPDLTGRLRDVLEEEGVEVLTGTRAVAAGRDGRLRTVAVEPATGDAAASGGTPGETRDGRAAGAPQGQGAGTPGEDRRRTLRAEEIFVATGRRPNVEDLGLEAAGVGVSPEGVVVDDRLRTSRKGVYAAGDVIGGHLFTHVADHEARTVIRNALFPFASRVDYSVIPWAVYTEPTLARIGPTEEEARRRHGDGISVHAYDLADLDRAVTDREARGLVKLVADRRGRLLAGHLLSPGAGSLVVEVALAVREDLKVTDLADLVHPYPTLSEGVRRAANQAYRDRLTPTTRRLLDGWHRLARALGL